MNESDSAVVVTRWRRYGKDRLYVTAADGSAVGWHDLVDDVAHPERPELADQLAAAVVGWRGSDAPPETETVTVTAPVSTTTSTVSTPSSSEISSVTEAAQWPQVMPVTV